MSLHWNNILLVSFAKYLCTPEKEQIIKVQKLNLPKYCPMTIYN